MTSKPRSTALLILALALLAAPASAQSVTVRLLNLSDRPMGRVLVATHPAALSPLFDPSDPPSAALRLFSQGSASELEAEAREIAGRHPRVRFGAVDGPAPGESVTVEIAATSYHRTASLAASLASGFAGFSALPAPRQWPSLRHDVLAWEAAGTVLAHRSLPSPVARAWIRYHRPPSRRALSAALPQLTPRQAAERADCLRDSATCVWRLEGGRGLCADCLPPLRPSAARTHCVD